MMPESLNMRDFPLGLKVSVLARMLNVLSTVSALALFG